MEHWNECGFGSCLSDMESRNKSIGGHLWTNFSRQNVERLTCKKLRLQGETDQEAGGTRRETGTRGLGTPVERSKRTNTGMGPVAP